MGMFDYVSCKLSKYEFDSWQTKGLGCQMDFYLIDEQGMFLIRDGDSDAEFVPYMRTAQFDVYTVVKEGDRPIERGYQCTVKGGRVMSLIAYADRDLSEFFTKKYNSATDASG